MENFSRIDMLMKKKLRGEIKFVWDDSLKKKTFKELKQSSTMMCVITILDSEEQYVEFIDASSTGLGGILMPNDKVVVYAS